MQEEEALKRVTEYLITKFQVPPGRIHPEAHLFKDLEMDSIDALDWFAAMESEIGLPVIEKELKTVRTIQDVVDYVVRNLKENADSRG